MVVRVLACGYDAEVRTGKNTGLSEHCYWHLDSTADYS